MAIKGCGVGGGRTYLASQSKQRSLRLRFFGVRGPPHLSKAPNTSDRGKIGARRAES